MRAGISFFQTSVYVDILTFSHVSWIFLMTSRMVNPFQKVFNWLLSDPSEESLFMAAIALHCLIFPKKGNAKECSNYRTIVLISHASKVMLKILQARLQQYVTMNFQMFKLVLEKAEEPEFKLPTSTGSWKKQESSRTTSISALLTMPKPLTVWITINCGKFWKRGEYQTTWPASWETCMQIRKQ